MLDQTTILDSSFSTPAPEPTDILAELVGEGKKYKTTEELAKAKLHADKHIETILAEKRELEEKYSSAITASKTVDDLLAALDKKPEPKPMQTPSGSASLSQEEIKSMISNELSSVQQRNEAERTKQEVFGKLTSTFGSLDAARSAIAAYAGGNTTKLTALDALLVADFDNAVTLIRTKADGASFSDSVTSTRRVTSPSSPSGLTWSKCEQVRKENPKLYRSREFQVEMHNASSFNPNFMRS